MEFNDLKEVTKNALKWFEQNKCVGCAKSGSYSSPRISSEYPDCATPFSFDLYNMCSYGCLYCFAFFQKSNNPAYEKDGSNLNLKKVNVDKLIRTFEGEYPNDPYYKYFIKKRKVMHIGGMADNFCNFERHNKEGVKLIEYLLKTGYPIIISSKGTVYNFPEYKTLFEKYKDIANCVWQSSIITYDRRLAAQIEVGVPSPEERFKNMKWLSDLGYYTILRLRPFMVGISDKTLPELMNAMKESNCKSLSTEFYAMDMRVNEESKDRYDWFSQLAGFDYTEYYKTLSPQSRGTYRRLNRNVKERFVKYMYKFCVDNDILFACSDPDFKELNMSGCCCGLPDNQGEISNYQKNQLTQVLKDLRIKYVKSNGEDKYLKLSDCIYDQDEQDWREDGKLYFSDMVCCIGQSSSERDVRNFWIKFKEDWNNTRSPKCPINYFDGKIIDSGKQDEEGNIIYEYNPSDYEAIWKEEGWFK